MTALLAPAPRIVLGLDPGTKRMGYGLLRLAPGRPVAYVEAGVLTAPAGWPLWRRLRELGAELEKLVREHRPAAVGVERGFVPRPEQGHGGQTKSELMLAEARGVCVYVVASVLGIEAVQYAPSTVKKAAVGAGNATKEQVAAMVRRRLGLLRTPEPDAADALAVALCAAMAPGGVSG